MKRLVEKKIRGNLRWEGNKDIQTLFLLYSGLYVREMAYDIINHPKDNTPMPTLGMCDVSYNEYNNVYKFALWQVLQYNV